ncbi:hypothetical protein SAMN04487990_10351 [Bizionia paragorgiae]|uniref:Uncharacterized protein n=1 Tax=Bizionia paragorgiae TaxID=283786 RepID=A0A1H3WEF5_BIZPA|nr:hypothetical protein SAMN04487990_10351 [Bizionia paragorgiae]
MNANVQIFFKSDYTYCVGCKADLTSKSEIGNGV